MFVPINRLFDSDAFLTLKKSLDAASLRQRTIANNIANVDTPGFKRADVTFEEELKVALEKNGKSGLKVTNPKHISNKPKGVAEVSPKVIKENSTVFRNDLNNVDIDKEMAKLAENNLAYNTLAQLINQKLRGLGSAIQEGRK
ncbi:MAG: flagellar basal body rod protein FlgB [Armatimonadetes bacterium CG07_land_8_20_14_0_80_40_9]|nr:MAG: flagellar basal body rod protein FlgB [Armatimonadetes bacterium CG07_land_8_20_14_0_80_40_9]